MKNTLPTDVRVLIDLWESPQRKLPKVIRWKKYLAEKPGVRKQNSLQHSHSITMLGIMMVGLLRPFIKLNEGILISALAVHDVGEGEIGEDTHYIDKSVSGDLREYRAFRETYGVLDKAAFKNLHHAFLLQFARKNPKEFPDDARAIMTTLYRKYKFEAIAFDAIERWDYVLFAIEQYLRRENRKVLVQTLRNQAPHLDRLANELPGFGETVWTNTLSAWCAEFMLSLNGRWEETKAA